MKTTDSKALADSIRNGDTVTISTPHGGTRKGRAVMRSPYGGWVLNGGGRHGTPLLSDDDNVVAVRHISVRAFIAAGDRRASKSLNAVAVTKGPTYKGGAL